MDKAFPTPEAAAKGSDPGARVHAVEYSPDGRYAIVFLEYNPDSWDTPPPFQAPKLDICPVGLPPVPVLQRFQDS